MRSLIFGLLVVFSFQFTFAQKLELNWSDEIKTDNKTDGFFSYYIDANKNYVYAKYVNFAYSKRKQERKIKIIAYDKKTMQRVGAIALKGFPENAKKAEKYASLIYYRTLVFENTIYVFWRKEAKKKEELYVETFDAKLVPVAKLKKIYDIPNHGGLKAKNHQTLLVMGNEDVGEKVLIGGELPVEPESPLKVEYKLLNRKLEVENSGEVELPVKTTKKNTGIMSWYKFGNDSKLYVANRAKVPLKERPALRSGEFQNYLIVTAVDLSTANKTCYPLHFDDKNLHNVHFLIDSNAVKLFGFYADARKDSTGKAISGIFNITIKPGAKEISDTTFNEFDKVTLDKLFENDREDRDAKGTKTNTQNANNSTELLDSKFEVEWFFEEDNKDIVMFCSKKTESHNRDNTKFFCKKDNVTVFKTSSKGKLIWTSNLDRRITYEGTNIYDVRAVKKDDKYFVIYGSKYEVDSEKKNYKSKKGKSEFRNNVEYAVFNSSDGKYQKQEINVNEANEKAKRAVTSLKIAAFDDDFYIHSETKKYKPIRTAIYSVAGFFTCGAMLIPIFADKNNRWEKGYVGTLLPKGK